METNNTYLNYYNVANVIIEVTSPFPFEISGQEAFGCEAPERVDYRFEFIQVDDVPNLMKDSEYICDVRWAHQYRKPDGSYQRAFLWQEKYYAAVSEIMEGHGVCYYVSESILYERLQDGFELFNYLCIEEILLQFGALVLHSSHVRVGNQGFVFSAPSQTGKSTQAELWRQHAAATVMNGDRSVLRKQQGQWRVFGCPMSGTSGIHLQGNEPLTNIVMLAQGLANELTPLTGMMAFRQVFPQITVPSWDGKQLDYVMERISELITEVPVWYYSCTKEKEAVFVLKEKLGL